MGFWEHVILELWTRRDLGDADGSTIYHKLPVHENSDPHDLEAWFHGTAGILKSQF